MATTQATFDEWSTGRRDPFAFETYGPTADHPTPTVEVSRTVWRERLRQAGFCPDSLAEAEGIHNVHVQRGFHPADEHREQWAGSNRTAFERAESNR
jgi:hypothetical protein